jgi:hypothetical protein
VISAICVPSPHVAIGIQCGDPVAHADRRPDVLDDRAGGEPGVKPLPQVTYDLTVLI